MKPLKAISLGAGVQSTTLLWLSATGVIDRADVALFADTGWEPAAVYAHLEQLERDCPIPIKRVRLGNLREDALASKNGKRFASMPLHILNQDGTKGMARRQCTYQYKIRPIRMWLRDHLAEPWHKRPGAAQLWIGISLDEVHRMKPADVQWVEHRWPLIDAGMTRTACVRWLEDHGKTVPPKSSCIGCPFHGNDYWRDLHNRRPSEWTDAVEFDTAIRSLPRFAGQAYLHPSLVPLRDVPFELQQGDLFAAECEGMCGV